MLKRIRDFTFQTMSDGVPALWFIALLIISSLLLIFVIYKICRHVQLSHYIRLVLYSLLGLIVVQLFMVTLYMSYLTVHLENPYVDKYVGTIERVEYADEGYFDITLTNHKSIKAKNIVDNHNKSLKDDIHRIDEGMTITYYTAHTDYILKGVVHK